MATKIEIGPEEQVHGIRVYPVEVPGKGVMTEMAFDCCPHIGTLAVNGALHARVLARLHQNWTHKDRV